MSWSTLVMIGVLVVASIVGASGVGAAQSDETLVTLTVDVVVPSSNQLVGGVTLVATWDGGEARARTASNGKAFIDVPRGASVEIRVDDDVYTRNSPYTIRVATEKDHTIEVARKADVDVVVSDAEGPVTDAQVAIQQEGVTVVSGRTDSEGRFPSGTIAQGTYTLSVVKPGYYQTTTEVVVAGSPEKSVQIARGRVDYDIVVEDPHFDPARPVANATISVQTVGNHTTGDRGAAAPLLPVNTDVRVTVSKEGYEPVTKTISVNESEGSALFSLSRKPGLSLTAVNQRVVVGEVVPVEVTNAYGEPAAGVTILVDGEPVRQTDSAGEATVPIESAGDHELRARQGKATSNAVTVSGVGEGGSDSPTDVATTATETTTAEGPGFGPSAVFLALGALLLLTLVSRRDDP